MPNSKSFQRGLHIFSCWMALQLAALAADEKSGIKVVGRNPETGIAAATVVDPAPLAYTAQCYPVNAKGELVSKGDVAKQAVQVLKNVDKALKAAGSEIGHVVKVNVYAANASVVETVKQVLARRFRGEHQPAVAFVAGGLAEADVLVAMDAVGVSKTSGTSVKRLPTAAVLPKGGIAYISGQADKGALPEATAGTLKKLQEALDFLGLKKEDVVQCKAFINPITEVAVAKKEFEKFFAGQPLPPIIFVEWTSKDPVIEIETIAMSKNAKPSSEPLEYLTPPGITASAVYAKIVRVNRGRQVYVSGLYGTSAGAAELEVTEIFASLDKILKEAGSDLKHLSKATYYVSNNETSGKLNALRPKYYDPKRPPAASKAMVKDVGVAGKGITLDMIGVVAVP